MTSTLTLILSTSLAHGIPLGGSVSAGQASITSTSLQTTINQSTTRAVINWSRFDIRQDEKVQFNQPTTSSITLNRVGSAAGASQINGMMTANGNVWIVNPNGMVFGKSSQVNVGGMLATTSNITDNNFMAGVNNFTPGSNPNASVSNAGSITVKDAGLAALVAPNVANSGTITAKLGKVRLALSDSYTVDLYGDGLISLYASPAITSGVLSNSGTIQANGGSVALTAAAASTVVDSVINMDGVIDARAENGKTGSITIYASGSNAVSNNVAANKDLLTSSSAVQISGTLDASGYGTGQKGGTIQVLGDNIGILSGAKIDASGDAGGGTIRIGGDFHGQGTTPTALHTIVQPNTSIKANAITTGNGGDVTIWADDNTDYAGNIEAKGGTQSGDGGYVETSGHNTFAMSGTVNASASNGNAGTWLLDPNDVTITNTSSTTGSSPNFSDTGSPANVNTADIISALNGGTSVNVTASGSITVNNSIFENTYNGTESLTLNAGNNITLGNNVAITASGNSKLNVTLDSNTANVGGGIGMNSGSSITSNGGNILLSGGADPSAAAAAVIVLNGNNTLNAGAGAVTLRANGTQFYSIYLNGSNNLIETTSGPIDMESLNTLNRQAIIVGSGTTITTGTGSITIRGETANYANLPVNSIGVTLDGVISSTGTGANVGAIDITGIAHPNGGYYTFGIACCSTISSVDGNITLNGTDSSATLYPSNPGYNIGLLMNNGSITSTGNGVISLIGTGDATSNSSGNFGIQLGGTVSAHNGAINLTGTGGGTGSSENGIYIGGYGAIAISSTGTAPINITGMGAAGDTDLFSTSGNTIGGASDTGNITFNADTFDFTTNTIRTAGQVIFEPLTTATSIGVAGGTGTAQISSSLLGQVTSAGGITIGSTSDTATMNVGSYSWSTPVTFDNGTGDIDITNGSGALSFSHALNANTTTGNVNLTATTGIVESGGGSITTQGGNVIFDADSSGSTSGGISLGSGTSITSHGGNIMLGGGADPTTGYVTSSGSNAIYLASNDTFNSGTGNITMRGEGISGSWGIYLGGSNLIKTTTGSINLLAKSDGVSYEIFTFYEAPGTTITTNTGGITLSGIGADILNSNADQNMIGLSLQGNVSSTGSGANVGAITLTGTAYPNGSLYTDGIAVTGAISSVDGNITLNGVSSSDAIHPTSAGGIGTGILLSNNANITSTGNGAISLTGTGDMNNTAAGTGGVVVGYGGSPVQISAHNGSIDITGIAGGTGSNANGVYMGGPSSVLSTGTASINITATGGSGGADIVSTSGDTIGGPSALSNITFNADTFDFTTNTIRTTGQVIFQPLTTATSIGVAGGAGTAQITSSLLGQITAGDITIGSMSDTASMTLNANNWNAPLSLFNGSGSIFINGAQAMGSNNFLARSASGNITLGSSGSISSSASGTAITLVASGGNFTDSNSSSSALSATGGRWLVYSTNPANDTDGALSNNFRRFSCTYGGSCPSVPATGNGFLYAYTPILTATPDGITTTYGNAAPNLTGYAYTLSGYLGSDATHDNVTGSLNGTTNYTQGSNAGFYDIDHSSGTLASAMGYSFSYANNATAVTAGQRTLTASLTETVNKIYDQTTNATLAAGNYILTNVYGADNVTLNNPTSGHYNDANAGTGKNVYVSGLALRGGNAGNYVLASTAISGPVGEIDGGTVYVTPNTQSRLYSSFNPVLTYSYTDKGGLPVSFSGALYTSANLTSVPGSYSIVQGSLMANGNYDLLFTSGLLTVTELPNVIAQYPVSSFLQPASYNSQTSWPGPLTALSASPRTAQRSLFAVTLGSGLIYFDASMAGAFGLTPNDFRLWSEGIEARP